MTKAKENTIALNLSGVAARQVISFVAYRFALLTTWSRMVEPEGTTDAPWASISEETGVSMVEAWRIWVAATDREWEDYRKIMSNLFNGDYPIVPFIHWPPHKREDGVTIPCGYNRKTAMNEARDYSRKIVRTVLEEK